MYRLVKLLAALTYLAGGGVGLLLCARFVLGTLGALAAGVSILLFPLTLLAAPWLALLRAGEWAPLLAVYGGAFVAGILHALARAMERGARRGGPEPEG